MLKRLREIAHTNVLPLLMDIECLALTDCELTRWRPFCPDLDRALREAHRVLRPGGRLAAAFPVQMGRLSAPPFDAIREQLPQGPADLVAN